MKRGKIIIALAIVCTLLSGCGLGLETTDRAMDIKASAGVLGSHSSYFERYSCEKSKYTCKVSGTICQEDDRNGILTDVVAGTENGSVTVTGSMHCTEGNIRLVYISSDGTENLIVSGTDLDIDVEICVGQGGGSIGFAGDGQSAVCEFDLGMEAKSGAAFVAGVEEEIEEADEIEEVEEIDEIEEVEEIDDIEDGNRLANLGGIEEAAIKELENTWPEQICYHADGVYGDPLSTEMKIDAPVTLSIVCETLDGELHLQIVDQNSKKVCYDIKNPDGEYTVAIDKAGDYQVLFYAKKHVGSVEITSVEREKEQE